jgi:hypothetical protein
VDRVTQLVERVDRLEQGRHLARNDDVEELVGLIGDVRKRLPDLQRQGNLNTCALAKLETSLAGQQQVTGGQRNLWMELQASHNNLVNRLARTEQDLQA